MKNKRGLSAIVATSLIILVSIVLVTILFISIKGIVSNLNSIDKTVDLRLVSSEGYTVWDEENHLATVQIRRGSDNSSDLIGIDIVFILSGNSVTHYITDVPGTNGAKTYQINLTGYEGSLDYIRIYPVFSDLKVGDMESELSISEIVQEDIAELIDDGTIENNFETPTGSSGSSSGGGSSGGSTSDDTSEETGDETFICNEDFVGVTRTINCSFGDGNTYDVATLSCTDDGYNFSLLESVGDYCSIDYLVLSSVFTSDSLFTESQCASLTDVCSWDSIGGIGQCTFTDGYDFDGSADNFYLCDGECDTCTDCDFVLGIGTCSYDRCKNDCGGECYFVGPSWGPDCISLTTACSSINSCSDYSEEECSNNPCSLSVDSCSWNSGSGVCEEVSTCGDTCGSLGYSCGTQTVCGSSVNCGTCSSGYTCTSGTCVCTQTCSNLGYSCGTQTVCGSSVNCGTCSSGYECNLGSCIEVPESSWEQNTNLYYADASWYNSDASYDLGAYISSETGDVNNDGYDDFLVGSLWGGEAYLVFGKSKSSWGGNNIISSYADVTFSEDEDNTGLGRTFAVGNVNGDSYDDIIIGATQEGSYGTVYLFLGKPTGSWSDMSVSNADASWYGVYATSGDMGGTLSTGDVDGDGRDDILIGSPSYDSSDTCLILGKGSGWSNDVSLANADATFPRGYYSSSIIGDVNNDGYDDILFGDRTDNSYAGKVYLFLGGPTADWSGDISLSDADASWESEGGSYHTYLDTQVVASGNFNGDDYEDIIIVNNGASYYTEMYLILGRSTSSWEKDVSITDVATASWYLDSTSSRDYYKFISDISAGDIDGDGYDDILIGESGYDYGYTNAGKTWLIRGKANGWEMDVNMADESFADASWYGEASGSYSGESISMTGDIDDDGYNDVLIGAAGGSGDGYGKVYLVLSDVS